MAAPGRTLLALAATIVLPTLIFGSLQIASGYRVQTVALEEATLARAQKIIGDVDARLNGVGAALGVMTTIRSLDARDWTEAHRRVREIMALDPDWRAVRLIDVEARREIFDTRRDLDAGAAIETMPTYDPLKAVTVGGVSQDFMGCACIEVAAPVMREGRARYLFVLALGAARIQALTLATAGTKGVTGVVDADGDFVSRTVAFEERVGTPASVYVRNAIRDGRRGVYEGVTIEGLENVTAFVTSPETGWSAHVAVASAAFDTPLRGWWTATAIAALVSLALAGAMTWLGFRLLSEERDAALRLEQTARAEAIGKLAGGMAHDFNNMLTIVISSLELMRRRIASGRTDVSRYVESASEGAQRAADLTRKMLAFSRRQILEPRALDANLLLAEMRELLRRTLPANVVIKLELLATWPVHADPRELENAVLNLAVNARDAMPDGGVLTIATRDVAAAAAARRRQAGDAVEITVGDTGCGMTPEVAAKAFEPFFTTKAIGAGTGLGLSQVYGFSRQSGGRVELASGLGEGTIVSILMPRSREKPAAPVRGSLRAAVPTGTPDEVILVVEDDQRVMRSTVETLRELGYTVRHASDGAAALEALAGDAAVRLLFTDIMMPGIGGRELAERARAERADLKILFATGYERDPKGDAPPGRILLKPYTLEDLAQAVRQALDG